MNKFIRSAIFALMLFPAPGSAQDLFAGLAAYGAGDYATALREWTPLAEQGDADAQSNLGLMYAEGDGVPQDYAEAVRWYQLAAEQGHAGAQARLQAVYEKVNREYVDAQKAVAQQQQTEQQQKHLLFARSFAQPRD